MPPESESIWPASVPVGAPVCPDCEHPVQDCFCEEAVSAGNDEAEDHGGAA
jgi:hypothetical protein